MSGAFAPPSTGGGGGSTDLASPAAIGSTTPNTIRATDLTIVNKRIEIPSAIQTLTATSVINPNASTIAISSASAILLTSNPQISAGTNGQEITLCNVGSFNITFTSNGVLWGQAGYVLYGGRIVKLKYLSAYSSWLITSTVPQDVDLPGIATTGTPGLNTNSLQLANTAYVNTSNRPALRAFRSTTSQAGLTQSAFTQLTFNTESLDTNSIHDTSTGNATIPASAGGLYSISAGMFLSGFSSRLIISVFNGSTELQRLNDSSASTDTLSFIAGSLSVQLNGGDVINIRGFYISGTASQGMQVGAALSFFTMCRLNV